jgi:hypothetical protein
MLILTTLSPTNAENQIRAVSSWKQLGYKVVSINTQQEIQKLSKDFNVNFHETTQTGKQDFNKEYIRLNAFTDYVREHGDALLINSDIEIKEPLNIEKSKETVYIFSRKDYETDYNKSVIFESGYDAFYITKEFSKYIPRTRLVLGQCHWDYYLPIIAIKNGFILRTPIKLNMFHKVHGLQYNNNSWKYTAKIFSTELGLSGNPHSDSKWAFNYIKSKINLID